MKTLHNKLSYRFAKSKINLRNREFESKLSNSELEEFISAEDIELNIGGLYFAPMAGGFDAMRGIRWHHYQEQYLSLDKAQCGLHEKIADKLKKQKLLTRKTQEESSSDNWFFVEEMYLDRENQIMIENRAAYYFNKGLYKKGFSKDMPQIWDIKNGRKRARVIRKQDIAGSKEDFYFTLSPLIGFLSFGIGGFFYDPVKMYLKELKEIDQYKKETNLDDSEIIRGVEAVNKLCEMYNIKSFDRIYRGRENEF